MSSTYKPRVAVVTGGSAGLGKAIASELYLAGYKVAIIGRDLEKLERACGEIDLHSEKSPDTFFPTPFVADLSKPSDVLEVFAKIQTQLGDLDVLVNNVGMSDRGTIENLDSERLMQVIGANLIPTLLCSRAAVASLARRKGVIVNIGSLAAKVGPRYLGGYPAAKHALSGLTQQMRLEWKASGVHVGQLNPGPIRRDDAGTRYANQTSTDPNLPASANLPGGGTRVKGLPAEKVAKKVLRMIKRRQTDVMLPSHLRPLVAIGNLWPPLGDWLLLRFTK